MKKLVDDLMAEGHLRTGIIQGAFSKISRRDFVPIDLEREAGKNIPLPIGSGKQIIQPQKAAFVLENLDLKVGQKVLCISSDSGWIPNLLAEIVDTTGKIIVVDEITKAHEIAKENSQKYDFFKNGRIEFIISEEKEGFPREAPYDRIISLASFSEIPENIKKQLKIGGKMMIPVKSHYVFLEKKTPDNFFVDDEIHLKDLKIRAANKIYSFNP